MGVLGCGGVGVWGCGGVGVLGCGCGCGCGCGRARAAPGFAFGVEACVPDECQPGIVLRRFLFFKRKQTHGPSVGFGG